MMKCGRCFAETEKPILCQLEFLCLCCYLDAIEEGPCDRCGHMGRRCLTHNGFQLICWPCMKAEKERVFRLNMDRAARLRHG